VKRTVLFLSFLLLTAAVACSARVSLGELPADPDAPAQGSAPTLPAPRDGDDAATPPPLDDDGGALDAGPAPYLPCAGKACGQSCALCDPLDPGCVETAVVKQCQGDGTCAAAVPVCTYNACAGKACGQSCRVCDPADPNCFETAVLKQCNLAGQCTPNAPGC
jgi:hypothetical protein